MAGEKKINMIREPQNDGSYRYRRIPWDIVRWGETSGVQPAVMVPSIANEAVGFSVAGTDKLQMTTDMFFDDDLRDDEIKEIYWFDSEVLFNEVFDSVHGYYDTDASQSNEFGYPRS